MKKTFILPVMIMMIIFVPCIVLAILIRVKEVEPYAAGTWINETTVTLEDGQLFVEGGDTLTVDVDKLSTVDMHVVWDTAPTPGYLPVLIIRNPSGYPVTWVSGDSVNSYLTFDANTVGRYTMEWQFYPTVQEFADAVEELTGGQEHVQIVNGGFDGFDHFGEEGTSHAEYTMELNFYEKAQGVISESEVVKLVVFLAAFISLIICIIILRKSDAVGKYDERQLMVQGLSFRYGFFTMMLYYGLIAWTSFLIEPYVEASVLYMVGILLGVLVYLCYSIMNDAYFALNDKKAVVTGSIATIGFLNIGIGIASVVGHGLRTNGKLGLSSINLIAGVEMLCVLVVLCIKLVMDKKDEE